MSEADSRFINGLSTLYGNTINPQPPAESAEHLPPDRNSDAAAANGQATASNVDAVPEPTAEAPPADPLPQYQHDNEEIYEQDIYDILQAHNETCAEHDEN
ncbi:hypothetical protein KEM55_001851 [Ascosphaera atra]|nr:hypothetical protein KEM55_001851 [Ascosphaera atra]